MKTKLEIVNEMVNQLPENEKIKFVEILKELIIKDYKKDIVNQMIDAYSTLVIFILQRTNSLNFVNI